MSVRVIDRTPQAIAAIRAGARAGVGAGALMIETRVKELLSLKGPGVRSLPGEPPAVQTGHLRRSVTTVIEEQGDTIRAKVGPQADYGRHLEFGTSRMAARPFLRPALDEKGDAATQAIRDHIARALSAALPRAV